MTSCGVSIHGRMRWTASAKTWLSLVARLVHVQMEALHAARTEILLEEQAAELDSLAVRAGRREFHWARTPDTFQLVPARGIDQAMDMSVLGSASAGTRRTISTVQAVVPSARPGTIAAAR